MNTTSVISGVAVVLLSLGACSDGGGGLEAFCETHTNPELQGLDPSNTDQADQLSEAMAQMEANAPDEIKDDVTTTREGFEAVQSGDFENIDIEEFQAAATRVEEYAEDNCK